MHHPQSMLADARHKHHGVEFAFQHAKESDNMSAMYECRARRAIQSRPASAEIGSAARHMPAAKLKLHAPASVVRPRTQPQVGASMFHIAWKQQPLESQ